MWHVVPQPQREVAGLTDRRTPPWFLLVAVVLTMLIAACSGPRSTSQNPPDQTRATSPIAPMPGESEASEPSSGTSPSSAPPVLKPPPIALNVTGPVPVPTSGALVGAWVKPAGRLTQSGRVTAVAGLQNAIGRELDIVNTYRRMTEAFPTSSDYALTGDGATLMVSWATPDTREITSGRYDQQLVAWAKRFASFPHPILLRVRWEMDRPSLRATMWSGPDYVAAWRHIRTIFHQQRVRNVSWVWCPTALGFANGFAPAFYPGDDQVDWVCVDAYASTKLQPLAQLLQPFLSWAAGHPKPIVIGEFGVSVAYPPDQRVAWMQAAGQLMRGDPQIKAACYFDSNPSGAPSTGGFALPARSAPMDALAELFRAPYFNPQRRLLSPPTR